MLTSFKVEPGIKSKDVLSPILFNIALKKLYENHSSLINHSRIRLFGFADDLDVR